MSLSTTLQKGIGLLVVTQLLLKMIEGAELDDD